MEFRYNRDEWSRGAAWRHLRRNKPSIELDGHTFQPRDHHFQRDHFHDESWGWFVYRWVCEGCTEEPSQKPPDLGDPDGYRRRFTWATWIEYDGTEATGFTLPVDWTCDALHG
jgi:hypothetical protein